MFPEPGVNVRPFVATETPLSVSETAPGFVSVVGSMGAENVTATDDTGVFRGLETCPSAVTAGGVRITCTTRSLGTDCC